MNEKEKVVLMFDFLEGPIWKSHFEKGEPLTGIEIIDNNDELAKLNQKCSELYSECYEFDVGDQPCIFNKNKAKENKKEILDLLSKIINKLDEINDGSFYIEDLATKEIEKF